MLSHAPTPPCAWPAQEAMEQVYGALVVCRTLEAAPKEAVGSTAVSRGEAEPDTAVLKGII